MIRKEVIKNGVNGAFTSLLVIDNPPLAEFVIDLMENMGFTVKLISPSKEGTERIKNTGFDLVLFDSNCIKNRYSLLNLCKASGESQKAPVSILMAESHESGLITEIIKAGISGIIIKPINPEELVRVLNNTWGREIFRLKRGFYEDEPEGRWDSGPVLIGKAPSFLEIKEVARRVSNSDLPILICGESGTGKELLARYTHEHSGRKGRGFLRVNCAAIPQDLLESELFGHEKGAYTGAHSFKPGKFEFANGGTMLLDEVGEIPFSLQAKLLHVLQDGTFERLGSNKPAKTDVRIMAATNTDLKVAIEENRFRKDLFYRLNTVTFILPPLRERIEDIPLLLNYFMDLYSKRYKQTKVDIPDETLEVFMNYTWPGNVRELGNIIRQIVVMQGVEIPLANINKSFDKRHIHRLQLMDSLSRDGPLESHNNGMEWPSLAEATQKGRQETEKALILKALQHTCWHKKSAAKLLRISYRALLYKVKQYGLDSGASSRHKP
ncbi:MAG: hypothetical protein A3G93_01450 [Nitrospinae bacterium RIFCSPLOWO2_12_FULL_45_22]|nr:MAG: hypothetical protein A3G93_01450 [Nitrospinae bacterium RIFCSPLOWO2_12_FULL_45_22]